MTIVVELKNAEKEYTLGKTKVHALQGVSLKVKKGEFISILGPSGCGKSTMLHLMGLLDKPTRGEVIFNGKTNITNVSDEELSRIRRVNIGFIFQQFFLSPNLTVAENVELPMVFENISEQERIKKSKKLLKSVGLGHRLNHMPHQLSGGERQRVAIARALANNPSVILADEPTGNLDSKTGKMIMELFNDLNKKGNTIVLVTHDEYLAKNAQKIIKMLDGRIIEEINK